MPSIYIPQIIERSARGERSHDVFSRLLMDRVIFLGTEINDDVANLIIAQLLFLEADGPGKEIQIYLNCPGGSVSAGLAIYDTMKYLESPVGTTCIGMAASMGCFLLAAGRHPNGVLVYRLEDLRNKTAFVYATDTEHYPDRMDLSIGDLAKGADLLIYDGMYTPEEYEKKYKGWGHSTWEKGFELARYAGVGKYAVFHHDPNHNDDFLDAYESEVREKCRRQQPGMDVFFAREQLDVLCCTRLIGLDFLR